MNDRLPFVYLASQPYSGSTLLSMLINAHPEMATVGEMTGLTEATNPDSVKAHEYTCSCGAIITACEFWQSVQSAMQSRGHRFDVADFQTRFELGNSRLSRRLRTGSLRSNRLEYLRDLLMRGRPGHTAGLQELGARNQAFAESVLEVTGKRVFFDASKYHMAIKYLTHYTDVELKVIHLVRDVRGATASLMRHIPYLDLRSAVQNWTRGNQNVERQLGHVPPAMQMFIRYEDLCSNTEETLAEVFRFCDVAADPSLAFSGEARSCVVGNQMRLQAVSEIKLDERWRRVFDASQIRTIESLAGDLHRKYGYSSMRDGNPHDTNSTAETAAIA